MRILLPLAGLAACLLGAVQAGAQTFADGSEAALGPEPAQRLVTLVGEDLRGRGMKDLSGARIAGVKAGRAGAVCGTVDVRNRMGDYTGPRGFVADLPGGFAGLYPDAPELRHPTSMAQFQRMQRALDLYRSNCMET